MFFGIVAGAVVVVAGFLGFAATRPNQFRVERRTRVNAPPERVFARINNFKDWGAWSPWEDLDPSMKKSMSGATSGQGAVYEWVGNKKVGEGRMEITSAEPPRKIVIKLDFLKPFEAHNTTEFLLEPQDGGTEVTWLMYGDKAFMSKVMGIFMNMDQLIGKDFEKGLARLKGEVERPASR
jgi:uncharacterized protein YndB with AHSA1/START domain